MKKKEANLHFFCLYPGGKFNQMKDASQIKHETHPTLPAHINKQPNFDLQIHRLVLLLCFWIVEDKFPVSINYPKWLQWTERLTHRIVSFPLFTFLFISFYRFLIDFSAIPNKLQHSIFPNLKLTCNL